MRKRVRIQVQLLPLRRAQTRGRRRLGASPDLARTTINNLRPSARKCRENVQSSPTNQLTETSPTTRSPQYDQQGGDRGFGGDRGGGGGGFGGGWNDRGGGGGGFRERSAPSRRPGDWDCPAGCGLVFASKSNCFRCGVAKPEGAGDDFNGGGGYQGGGGYNAEQPPPVDNAPPVDQGGY
jgi:RNA-binding protein FUS